ncbi:MAG: arylesterase [Sulfurospirillaceae bacterium]|nr:arylesterase [Sulfurospirillaceae bacterium]
MSFFKIILLVIVTIIIFSFINNYQDSNDENYYVPQNTKILAFGDSITYGYGVDKNASYPSQLANMLQTNVINAGVPGEDTRGGLKRLPSVLKKYKPQIIIICEGGNDIIRNKDLTITEQNIAKMIKLAQKQNIFVVLVGVPKLDILTVSTASFYYDLAKEFNVPLVDDALQDILNDNSLKLDDVHPNAKGYKILSKKIASVVTNQYISPNM